ncbi:MAG: hypothetical protein KFW09_05225, partial [Oscillospiraceae bacterium]|nr:hypothetical protein [Oscillospiraceae bacterium]
MNRCNNCNIYFHNNQKMCPLCNIISIEYINDDNYCSFPTIDNGKKIFSLLLKIIKFFAISFSIISLFVEYYISQNISWSFIVVILSMYIMFLFNYSLKKLFTIGKIVLYQSIFFIILTFIIDFLYGFSKWSIYFSIPIILLISIMVLIILMVSIRSVFFDYLIYLISLLFFGIIQGVFILININTPKIMVFITFLISVIILIGLFIFLGKYTKNEIKNRFH